jgi:hypothetical protein
MALDLSSYKVAFEELSDDAKFDNLVQAIQDSFNAIGDTSKMSWKSGLIFDPAQIKQNAATSDQALLWNGSVWAPTSLTLGKLAQSGAALNDVPQWNGSAWVPAAVTAPTTYRKATPKTVNTTVAATDLLNGEITIGAGVMGTNKVVRLAAWGDCLNNSGGIIAMPRFQVQMGGVTIIDTGAGSATGWNASATRADWTLEMLVQNAAAASQTVKLTLVINNYAANTAASVAFTTGTGGYLTIANAGVLASGVNSGLTIDTTTSKLLALNIINPSANALCETKLFGALVEVV